MTRLCTCLSEHMFPTPHPGLDPFESPQCPPNHPAASTHACDERLMPELGLFPKGPVCGSLCPLAHLPREGSALLGSLGSPTAEHGAHGYMGLPPTPDFPFLLSPWHRCSVQLGGCVSEQGPAGQGCVSDQQVSALGRSQSLPTAARQCLPKTSRQLLETTVPECSPNASTTANHSKRKRRLSLLP